MSINNQGLTTKQPFLDSVNFTDVTPGNPIRGDLITAQGVTPLWTRLAKGTANQVLSMDATATDVVWSTLVAGGTGTVTSFSAGNLSPLLTTSVATPTTTPALSFSLSNAGAHAFLGNNTGISAAPAYVQPNFTDLAGSVAAGQMPALTGDITTSAGTVATTLATVATPGTNTKITFNAKGLVTSGAQASLASADFANQGTTTTVLHGNAAGNPSFGAVVQGDVTNGYVDLSSAQGAIGGNKTFTGNISAVQIQGTAGTLGPASAIAAVSGNPAITVSQTGAAVDAKTWDTTATTTPDLQMRLINDAVNAATTWLTVSRTGMTANSVTLAEPLNVTGKTTVTGAISATTTITGTDFIAKGPNSCIDPTHPTYGAKGDDSTDDTAAMQAAINATPHGGCLNLGPRTYFINCGTPVSSTCLLIPYPIEFRGTGMNSESFGSVLRFPNTVAGTVDLLRLVGDANGSDGYNIHDFAIQCNTGPCGRSPINIDTTSFPINRLSLWRVGQYGSFGSYGIRSTNPTPLLNGFFTSTIGPENLIKNGILLQNAGDTVRIISNTIAFGSGTETTTAAIDASFDVGSSNFIIDGNNITQTKGGCIHLGSGAQYPVITRNFCEGGVGATDVGSNGASIDLDGVTAHHILGAEIYGNIIQAVTTNINNIRVNFADNTNIHSNTITRSGGTGVDIITTANATNTNIGYNRYEPTTDVLANILTDAGTGTTYALFPPQVGGMEFSRGLNKTGQADIVADSAGINTTETIIAKTPALIANRLIVGTHIRMILTGTCNASVANTSTFTVRMGTLGTTGDTAIATAVTGVSGTGAAAIPFKAVIDFTVRTIGASGTGFITLQVDSQGLTGIIAAQTPAIILPAMSTFNTTTASNILSVSYKSAATTTTSTFKQAVIEFIQN